MSLVLLDHYNFPYSWFFNSLLNHPDALQHLDIQRLAGNDFTVVDYKVDEQSNFCR